MWNKEQLLTAKYLTFFMLTDPFFTEREFYVEMMYAAVGNMFCEAFPRKTERYNNDGSDSDYLRATLENTDYYEITQGCYGRAYNMDIINRLYLLPNIGSDQTIILHDGSTVKRQGFGFGMFQFTFDRATTVMENYQDVYNGYNGTLTLGQGFAAEYMLLKADLNSMEDYRYDNLIRVSEIDHGEKAMEDKIYSLGYTFRRLYEKPQNMEKYKDGGERVQKWYYILEEALNGE